MPAFALPRVVKRLTMKFVVEVAFSVLVTLVATKIATGLLAPDPEAKATLRAEAPPPVAHPLQLPERQDTELSPAMSRFMEKAALAHVAPPRVEPPRAPRPTVSAARDEVLPAPEPAVSVAPAVWAATQPVAHAPASRQPAERTRAGIGAMVQQASLPPARPRGLGEAGPAVIAAPPAAATAPLAIGPAVDPKVGVVPRPKADIPETVAVAEVAPPQKPKKNLITRIGDAIPSPSGVVDGVGHAGKAIGDTIGSLFKF